MKQLDGISFGFFSQGESEYPMFPLTLTQLSFVTVLPTMIGALIVVLTRSTGALRKRDRFVIVERKKVMAL